jgi:hypothetical protein
MTRLLHRLAHYLGLTTGRVETWRRRDGTLMVGFRCDGCGKLTGVHPSLVKLPRGME